MKIDKSVVISPEALSAAEEELEQHDDFSGKEEYPLGYFVQLAFNKAQLDAYKAGMTEAAQITEVVIKTKAIERTKETDSLEKLAKCGEVMGCVDVWKAILTARDNKTTL